MYTFVFQEFMKSMYWIYLFTWSVTCWKENNYDLWSPYTSRRMSYLYQASFKHNTCPVMLQNMSDTPNLYLTNPTFKNIYSSTHPIPPSHIRCLVIWYYTLTNYFRENRNLLFRGYPIRHPNIVLTPWYNLTYTWCSFYCIMLFSVIKYYIKLFIYVTLYNFLSVWVLLWLSLT